MELLASFLVGSFKVIIHFRLKFHFETLYTLWHVSHEMHFNFSTLPLMVDSKIKRI